MTDTAAKISFLSTLCKRAIREGRGSLLLCALAMLPVFALLYNGFLNFYYVGDDFDFIRTYSSLHRIFRLAHHSYHYVPLGGLISSFPSPLFRENLLVANLSVIFMHAAACALVFALARALRKDAITSFHASLIFCTYYLSSQVIYWKTGRATAAATIFAILTFLCYKKYVDLRKIRWYFASDFFLILGLFSIEYSVLVILPCFLYDVGANFGVGAHRRFKDALRHLLAKRWWAYALPLLQILAIVSIRLYYGEYLSPTHQEGKVFDYFTVFPAIQACLNLVYLRHFVNVFRNPELGILMFLVVVTVAVVLFLRPPGKNYRPFIVWALGFPFLITLGTGGTTERYQYLPAVGFAIVLSGVVFDITGKLMTKSQSFARRIRARQFVVASVATLLLAPIEVHGFLLLKEKENLWAIASETQRNIVNTFSNAYEESPKGTHFYLVNIPDSLRMKDAEIPVARGGFGNNVIYKFGPEIRDKLHYLKLPENLQPKRYWMMNEATLVDLPTLKAIITKPGNKVLVFDENLRNLVRL